MPKGAHAKDPEFIAKRIKKMAEKREAREKFFIRIDEKFGVSRDTYNVILSERVVTEDTKNVYCPSKGFYGSFSLSQELKNLGVTAENIKKFEERVKVIKAYYKDGKLITDVPEGFVFDNGKEFFPENMPEDIEEG